MNAKSAISAVWKIVVLTVFWGVVALLAAVAGFVGWARAGRGTFRPHHPGRVRFALCQYGSRVGDLKWNFEHALAYAAEAVGRGADVVVLPEYSFTSAHDLRRGRAWVNLDEVPWMMGRLRDFARRHRCYLFANHGRTFGEHRQHHLNETVLVGPDGEVAAAYQKRFMALLDQRVGFGPGTNEGVIAEMPFADAGMLICKDSAFPGEFSDAYGDADLLVAQFGNITHWGEEWAPRGLRVPTACATNDLPDLAEKWHAALPKTMLMVNKTGVEDTFAYIGGSRVVGADGEVVALANSDENILYVDFPLGEDGKIDTGSPTVPEEPSDRVEGGHARKFRTAVRRLETMVPEPKREDDGD